MKEIDEKNEAMEKANQDYINQYMVDHPHLTLLSDMIHMPGMPYSRFAFDANTGDLWVAHVQKYAPCTFELVEPTSVAYSDVMRLKAKQDKLDRQYKTIGKSDSKTIGKSDSKDNNNDEDGDRDMDITNLLIDVDCANTCSTYSMRPMINSDVFIPFYHLTYCFMLCIILLLLAIDFIE